MFENCTKLDNALGYDAKFKDPATVEILEIAEDALISGYSKNTIAKLLVEEVRFKYIQAQSLAAKAWKNVMSKGKDRSEGLAERNVVRLEHIYKKAMENNDYKSAISALDQLNKIAHLYKDKVEISTNDFEFKIGE